MKIRRSLLEQKTTSNSNSSKIVPQGACDVNPSGSDHPCGDVISVDPCCGLKSGRQRVDKVEPEANSCKPETRSRRLASRKLPADTSPGMHILAAGSVTQDRFQ